MTLHFSLFSQRTLRSIAYAVLALSAFSVAFAQTAKPAHSDAEVHRFAESLLKKMTLEEKIGQMEQISDKDTPPATSEEMTRRGQVGSFLFVTDPVRLNKLQKIAMEESRLHIPLIVGYDVIHGYRTIYPAPLALASSWDPALVERVQSMAAREARASGVHWAFTPMVDIARDARWGRMMEGAGEDPYLGEQMAAAQVRGLQGPYVGSPNHILACVKHFAAYGGAMGGRDYDSVEIPESTLRNVYLRPYHAGVKAGTACIMSAYQDLNDVPATGNEWLMNTILRKEWNFKGFVVSDWRSIESLTTHGFATDSYDAAVRGIRTGINMEMTSSTYHDHLADAVKRGDITVAQIDALVLPLLEMKYRLGLFEHPYVDLDEMKRETGNAEMLAVARTAGEQTAVLLRNENAALPLRKDVHSIAVIGPLADSKVDTKGSWSIHGDTDAVVTIAQGIKEKFSNARVSVTKGVEIKRDRPSIFDDQVPPPPITLHTEAEREVEFQHAIELAKQAEVVVMVLGEAQNMNGEAASRLSFTLPGEQQRLLEAVVATGRPVVLLVMTARPVDLKWASEHVPAILNVWYPGTEGGHAVADLLAGDANPSGKLTVSWPRSAGQEPVFYNSNLTQSPYDAHRYWDGLSTPLYPFGYGLSYAKFNLGNLKLNSNSLSSNGSLTATVDVTNTSHVDGAEVVQLYTHQRAGSASRPVRELKAFQKVMIKAGETKSVALTLPAEELHYWSSSQKKDVLEPGVFDLWVGDSSDGGLHTTFNLTK